MDGFNDFVAQDEVWIQAEMTRRSLRRRHKTMTPAFAWHPTSPSTCEVLTSSRPWSFLCWRTCENRLEIGRVCTTKTCCAVSSPSNSRRSHLRSGTWVSACRISSRRTEARIWLETSGPFDFGGRSANAPSAPCLVPRRQQTVSSLASHGFLTLRVYFPTDRRNSESHSQVPAQNCFELLARLIIR